MTTYVRLLADTAKADSLLECCVALRSATKEDRLFEVAPESFEAVPGRPFAYWVSEAARRTFRRLPSFGADSRSAKQGLATADDFRFVRAWWEMSGEGWFGFAKGGAYSPFYSDVHLRVNWAKNGEQIKNNLNDKGNVRSNVWMLKDTARCFFGRPGITWPLRTNGLSFRAMPEACVFGHKGPSAFVSDDDQETLLALCSILNSQAFHLLVSMQLARSELAQSFEVGLIQQTPVPGIEADESSRLARLAHRSWSLKRTLDTVAETSHAFLVPAALRGRLGDYDPPAIEAELAKIQSEIDDIAFDLYGFSEEDRVAAMAGADGGSDPEAEAGADDGDDDEEETVDETDHTPSLLSWAVGVAFGRFDLRLATGEREAPPEPEPFDPLPALSPGMLPLCSEPFHVHPGMMIDDPGHPHDLARLVEEVLARVDVPIPTDVRRWLQRDFFVTHLKQYSKSRRKAPIYWPLSTASGSYTLWVYYPSLGSQTLYTAVNDFIEPKLRQVSGEVIGLRSKGGDRSRAEEKKFEELQGLESELIDLRDALLNLAPNYKPDHDDGVQISAAPLWPLFRNKPWQKVLKDTWKKLDKGDYDWAHLAMNYWPERVREKCETDKSLAIAHGLEELYLRDERNS